MSDIFDEVEEEVRKERWEVLWKKYGNYFLAFGFVVVLAVGGYRFWQSYHHHLSEQASDQYLAAQQLAETGDLAGAEAAFGKLTQDAPSGYATMAKFAEASVLLTENKRDAALAVLRELAAGDDVVLANAARLQMGWIEADYAPPAEIETVLKPLLASDNAYRFAAGEVIAYVDLRTGARNDAIAAYSKLAADKDTPEGIKQRAQAMALYLKANPDITSLPAVFAPPTLLPAQHPAPAASGPGAAPAAATPSSPASAPAAPAQESHPQ